MISRNVQRCLKANLPDIWEANKEATDGLGGGSWLKLPAEVEPVWYVSSYQETLPNWFGKFGLGWAEVTR